MPGQTSIPHTNVICVGNQKGGVGKTTNTIQIASALAAMGRKCLVIDLDMTAGATKCLGAPTEGWLSAYEMVTGAEDPEGCVIDDHDEEIRLPQNLHLIPSSRKLAQLDVYLSQNLWITPQDILLGPVGRLRGRYDYIFLDTPPNVTRTTTPALKAADYIILSALPDDLAIKGLDEALVDISNAQKYGNPRLVLLGVVIGCVTEPKTRLARHLIKYVDRTFVVNGRSLKFEPEITRSVTLQEAQRLHQTVFDYAPTHKVAEQYRQIAVEVERRIEALRIGVAAPQLETVSNA